MKDLSENKAVCKAKDICKSICDIRVKKDYDLTLSLYDAKAPEKPECTHNFKGSSDHSLVKILAIAGLVSITLSAICAACSLFKD